MRVRTPNLFSTISVLVENKFGVLTRIAGLFSGRGYNIDTLNVAPTQDPSASRMTIVTRGDDATLEQIVKQLNKLVDVLKVIDFRDGEYVDRELALVKVAVDSMSRAEVMQITDIFRAKNVGDLHDFGTRHRIDCYLDQRQFTIHIFAVPEVNDFEHIHQLVELLDDLLER